MDIIFFLNRTLKIGFWQWLRLSYSRTPAYHKSSGSFIFASILWVLTLVGLKNMNKMIPKRQKVCHTVWLRLTHSLWLSPRGRVVDWNGQDAAAGCGCAPPCDESVAGRHTHWMEQHVRGILFWTTHAEDTHCRLLTGGVWGFDFCTWAWIWRRGTPTVAKLKVQHPLSSNGREWNTEALLASVLSITDKKHLYFDTDGSCSNVGQSQPPHDDYLQHAVPPIHGNDSYALATRKNLQHSDAQHWLVYLQSSAE